MSHASELPKHFIYASLTAVVTFFFLYLFPLLAITFFKHSQYLSITDLCILHCVA